MIVTLDTYSGRPNPSWRLSDADKKQLIDRFSGRLPAAPAEEVNGLGYRGFIISADSDDDLPAGAAHTFRVGGPQSLQSTDTADSLDTSKFLLNSGSHVLEADLMSFLQTSIHQPPQPVPPIEPIAVQPAEPQDLSAVHSPIALPLCIIANTPYNPGFWNNPTVQPKNNCYNYAMNWRSDTFAQPGRISGHLYTAINCAAVGLAANFDGCHTYCSGSNKNVALVIAPGPGFVDFHWYRRQKEGFWAHKPGGGAVRNTDNSGRLIDGVHLTPANCDRGPYTIFCGYRFSPTGMRVS